MRAAQNAALALESTAPLAPSQIFKRMVDASTTLMNSKHAGALKISEYSISGPSFSISKVSMESQKIWQWSPPPAIRLVFRAVAPAVASFS